MRYLLDTNVLSELVRPRPEPRVVSWVEGQSPLDLAISVLTLGELTKGIEVLGPGKRRTELTAWIGNRLARQFVGRVLPIDDRVAVEWGRLSAAGARTGRDLPAIDGLLLATAAVHGLAFITRNERDCTNRGVRVVNPWSSQTPGGG